MLHATNLDQYRLNSLDAEIVWDKKSVHILFIHYQLGQSLSKRWW